jgi:adenosylhomocysteine nucleosidase
MRIGIVAALPGELKPLVRGWTTAVANKGSHKWIYHSNGDTWIATCAGMGADAARRAFAEAEADGPLGMVLSIGWAGALEPDLRPGGARVISLIIDAKTGERFKLTEGEPSLTLVTEDRVVGMLDKAGLRATYLSAAMVDMEAAAVAGMARVRGIPMACIKGVSDGSTANLPDLNRFIGPSGQLRTGALISSIVFRPSYWLAFLELGRNSKKAAQAMCDLVLRFILEKNFDRLSRTGSP